mmetsp:Transcript_591/g.837  ORF Transcript_591/g.837 Transcript_591/m.837 type:complete len:474 (-) Transcript_591:43-1464(-)
MNDDNVKITNLDAENENDQLQNNDETEKSNRSQSLENDDDDDVSERKSAERRRSRSPRSTEKRSSPPPPKLKDDQSLITIHGEEIGFILGRRGTTKQKLARASRTQITVESTRNTGHVIITGRSKDRERALFYIKTILSQRLGPVYIDPSEERNDVSMMEVPQDVVGFITGRQGAALRSIEDECATLMFFASRTKPPTPTGSPYRRRDEPDRDEVLAIFGDRRSRCAAKLKVMSQIEHKNKGTFIAEDGSPKFDIAEFQSDGRDDYVMKHTVIPEDVFSYALGKMGATRKKLQIASQSILQYVGTTCVCIGHAAQVESGLSYLRWLLEQRTGAPQVELDGRDDVTVVEAPSRVIGYITGARGIELRRVEERTGTFVFTDGDKRAHHAPDTTENVLIFARDSESRRRAERLIRERIDAKAHEDRRDDRRRYDEPPRRRRDDDRRDRYRRASPPPRRRSRSPHRRRERSRSRSLR